jgi:hypothetical protein
LVRAEVQLLPPCEGGWGVGGWGGTALGEEIKYGVSRR